MKAHLNNCIKCFKIIIIIVCIFTIAIFSSACKKTSKSNEVICDLDNHSLYPKVVEDILPGYTVEQGENKPYYILNDGGITEAFDTQAIGAMETGIANHWYPHYLATVIIAVDRDQTDALVTSWSDLLSSQQEIGFSTGPGDIQMLTAAMSYGLEGENYSSEEAIQILSKLNESNRLKIDSFQSSIIICFDYQAVSLIENGRNIEIIIPKEGTFTYEKGLLSHENLHFQGNIDKLLLHANLRLIEGQGTVSLYPNEISYRSAVRVMDYKYFAKITRNINVLFQRKVLNSRKYMSIDNREHLHIALVYIIIVTIWLASVLRRSMQKGISYAAFFTGIILNGWILVRLIKYQVEEIPTLNRYLWYGFYIFQLTLPLVILWMAWAIDKPEKETFPPKWWRRMLILICLLIVLVFTNDLHGLVFKLDLSRSNWGTDYTYGFGYYIILFVCIINLVIAFAILMKKSIKSPRKNVFIFPFGIFLLFGLYNYKYIMRDSFAYATDITIVTGFFVMLMFESCIRSDLIPVNTKYIHIFRRSPLKIQIINNKREAVIASALAETININTVEKVIALSPDPLLQEEDFLLFANSIPGGYVLWSEDVSKIQQLHKEIKKSTEKLTEANSMLEVEEKTKRSINEKNTKRKLMEQLENEIAENINKLSMRIEKLEYSENYSMDSTHIALLLCYIKRRCNLFFIEKKMHTIGANQLIMHIEELCEIAKLSNIQTVIANKIDGNLSIRYATLFYDFFYKILDLGVQKSCPFIIVDIEKEEDLITMRLLPSVDIGTFKKDFKFMASVTKEKGEIRRKKIEDTVGISISFPKGGVRND